MKTFHGSCTCGDIQFEADLDLSANTTRCNCSFCKKARFWFGMSKRVSVTKGADQLGDFQRKPASKPAPYLHFYFCKKCGVRPFSAGGGDFKGAEFYAVNLCALDDASDEELAMAPIHYADGQHDDWKSAPKIHGYL
jgi:hypothetical protein